MPSIRFLAGSLLCCIALAAASTPSVTTATIPTTVIATMATPASVELRERSDAQLQRGVEQIVDKLHLRTAVNQRHLALVVADITNPAAPRVAALNGDHMMYAASLPKIAILLGAMKKEDSGASVNPQLRDDITQMIRYSSNSAATRVLSWVGRQDLIELLKDSKWRLYDPKFDGGLWVGKDYAGGSAFQRDPLHNISHGATAMQVARLYYMMETGQLLSPQRTQEMKSVLSEPGIKHKFVAGLESRPGARIFRKSGTWQQFHADSALVESGGHRFILVGLSEDKQGGHWLADLAAPLHDLIVSPQERVASR